MITRRDSLKKLLVATGGLIALPGWARDWKLADVAVHTSSFSLVEQDTLAAVTDAIIPAGNSIGALSVGVDKFLQKLIDRCYEKTIGDGVKSQLAGLESAAKKAYDKQFSEVDASQRQELLLRLSNSEVKEEKEFFNLMKSETIRGFSTSREVMVDYNKFKLVPGHYYGCADVKA